MTSSRPLVLMVEDDPDTAALYKTLLFKEEMEVVVFPDIAHALAWVRSSSRTPNLLILDVCLPDGSGLDIFHILNKHSHPWPQLPVMLLSTDCDPRLPDLCEDACCGVFLHKLRDMDRFLGTAKDLISQE